MKNSKKSLDSNDFMRPVKSRSVTAFSRQCFLHVVHSYSITEWVIIMPNCGISSSIRQQAIANSMGNTIVYILFNNISNPNMVHKSHLWGIFQVIGVPILHKKVVGVTGISPLLWIYILLGHDAILSKKKKRKRHENYCEGLELRDGYSHQLEHTAKWWYSAPTQSFTINGIDSVYFLERG